MGFYLEVFSMLDKNWILFCTGLSGTGKTYFIKNILPQNAFYNLKSATTRPMRDYEQDGREYYFRDESYFDTEKFATHLWVNEAFWKPGDKKWLYGVPEFELLHHLGQDFTYDVIQPRYVAEMINWFRKSGLDSAYNYKILWFQPNPGATNVVEKRQNMPNDLDVRRTNTCNKQDFLSAGIKPDHKVICSPQGVYMDTKLKRFLAEIERNKIK